MNSKVIKELIQNGEKIDVEFKESKTGLNKDVYDTVCSFNNRNGGHILLGVNDKREIIGVSPDLADKMIKEFTTSINTTENISTSLFNAYFDRCRRKESYLYKSSGRLSGMQT